MRRKAHIMNREWTETFCGKRKRCCGAGHSIEYAQQQERNFGLFSLGGWCRKCVMNFKKVVCNASKTL